MHSQKIPLGILFCYPFLSAKELLTGKGMRTRLSMKMSCLDGSHYTTTPWIGYLLEEGRKGMNCEAVLRH